MALIFAKLALNKIMLKKLFVVALFCFLTISFNHPTSAAITYKSAKSTAVIYPYIQNERFVTRAMRQIAAAQYSYNATEVYGNFGTLDDLRRLGFIDSVLASGYKYGYVFAMQTVAAVPNQPATFSITATPRKYRKTGRTSFYLNTFGTLRGADKNGAVATADDPLFENECLPNEECTISNLRTLYSAEVTYQATSGNGSFGTLNQLHTNFLVNDLLARGSANGYRFTITTVARTNNTEASFTITAVPINYGVTGIRSFYVDTSGVVRGADRNGAPATADDPPIEN
jgi:hypothetical protein